MNEVDERVALAVVAAAVGNSIEVPAEQGGHEGHGERGPLLRLEK